MKELDWDNFIEYDNFSEEFVREHIDEVNWNAVSCSDMHYSDEFYDEFSDRLDWLQITYNKGLPEDFIRKHQDKVEWGYVSLIQDISSEFAEEFKDKQKTEKK